MIINISFQIKKKKKIIINNPTAQTNKTRLSPSHVIRKLFISQTSVPLILHVSILPSFLNTTNYSLTSPSFTTTMADVQYQQQQQQYRPTGTGSSILPRNGPSASQILAVVTLLPIGGILLSLAGITLAGSLIGLAVATPLLIIFSPILVPAVVTIGLAVAGIITSGAFGITALSSFSWIVNYMRKMKALMPPPSEQVEHEKRRYIS